MALTINHAYTATGTDAGNGEVNKARWNAALNYSGTLDVTNGGTGVTSSTGSGANVLGTAPALSAMTVKVAPTVTAGTNSQGQGAITSDINVITSTPNNPSGVTLPTATVGRLVKVVNKGTNAIIVYPVSGSSIDALSVNSGIQINANAVLYFDAASTTKWYSSSNNATNLSVAVGSASAQNGGTGQTSYTTGDILYAPGSYQLSKLNIGTTGAVLKVASGLPSWGSAWTSLGTITTTSLATQTLSGLSLTNYTFLRVVLNGVSTNSTGSISVAGIQVSTGTTTAGDAWTGIVEIDLTTGILTANVGPTTTANTGTSSIGTTALTTASTSISITCSTGAFDLGSAKVYAS